MAIACVTAYVLSRVSEPVSDQVVKEVPLSQKLLELYQNSSSGGDQNGLLNEATVQKSGVVGYNNARAKVVGGEADDGSFAHFYQTTDGNWYFFTVSKDQDKIACSDYDTDDLINAFIGFTCWDTAIESSSFVAHPQPIINEADQQSDGASGG